MVEGKKWFLNRCSRNLQTCAMAQAYHCSPYPQHNQENIKKNLIRSKGTLCDFRHSEYMSTPPVDLIHSPKTLKYPLLINLWSFQTLIHRKPTTLKTMKETCGWFLIFLKIKGLTILFKASLLFFLLPPSLCSFSPVGNIEQDRNGLAKIWTCDSRHWFDARDPRSLGWEIKVLGFGLATCAVSFWCRMRVSVFVYLWG